MSTSANLTAFAHDPGKRHRYIAPAYAARRLGQRIFSSKAEFNQRMRAYSRRGGRVHSAKLRACSKSAPQDDQIDLKQGKRPRHVDDRALLRSSGVRRCIRSEEEATEVIDRIVELIPTLSASREHIGDPPQSQEQVEDVLSFEPEVWIKVEEEDARVWRPCYETDGHPPVKSEDEDDASFQGSVPPLQEAGPPHQAVAHPIEYNTPRTPEAQVPPPVFEPSSTASTPARIRFETIEPLLLTSTPASPILQILTKSEYREPSILEYTPPSPDVQRTRAHISRPLVRLAHYVESALLDEDVDMSDTCIPSEAPHTSVGTSDVSTVQEAELVNNLEDGGLRKLNRLRKGKERAQIAHSVPEVVPTAPSNPTRCALKSQAPKRTATTFQAPSSPRIRIESCSDEDLARLQSLSNECHMPTPAMSSAQPPNSPRIRIESCSEEDLALLRHSDDGSRLRIPFSTVQPRSPTIADVEMDDFASVHAHTNHLPLVTTVRRPTDGQSSSKQCSMNKGKGKETLPVHLEDDDEVTIVAWSKPIRKSKKKAVQVKPEPEEVVLPPPRAAASLPAAPSQQASRASSSSYPAHVPRPVRQSWVVASDVVTTFKPSAAPVPQMLDEDTIMPSGSQLRLIPVVPHDVEIEMGDSSLGLQPPAMFSVAGSVPAPIASTHQPPPVPSANAVHPPNGLPSVHANRPIPPSSANLRIKREVSEAPVCQPSPSSPASNATYPTSRSKHEWVYTPSTSIDLSTLREKTPAPAETSDRALPLSSHIKQEVVEPQNDQLSVNANYPTSGAKHEWIYTPSTSIDLSTLPEASPSLLLPRSPSELSYLSEPDVGDIPAALVHSGDGSEESAPQAFPAWRSLPTSPAISPMTSFDSISELSDISDDTYEMSSTESSQLVDDCLWSYRNSSDQVEGADEDLCNAVVSPSASRTSIGDCEDDPSLPRKLICLMESLSCTSFYSCGTFESSSSLGDFHSVASSSSLASFPSCESFLTAVDWEDDSLDDFSDDSADNSVNASVDFSDHDDCDMHSSERWPLHSDTNVWQQVSSCFGELYQGFSVIHSRMVVPTLRVLREDPCVATRSSSVWPLTKRHSSWWSWLWPSLLVFVVIPTIVQPPLPDDPLKYGLLASS